MAMSAAMMNVSSPISDTSICPSFADPTFVCQRSLSRFTSTSTFPRSFIRSSRDAPWPGCAPSPCRILLFLPILRTHFRFPFPRHSWPPCSYHRIVSFVLFRSIRRLRSLKSSNVSFPSHTHLFRRLPRRLGHVFFLHHPRSGSQSHQDRSQRRHLQRTCHLHRTVRRSCDPLPRPSPPPSTVPERSSRSLLSFPPPKRRSSRRSFSDAGLSKGARGGRWPHVGLTSEVNSKVDFRG